METSQQSVLEQKNLKLILEEMFKRVGAEFSDEFISRNQWYMEYTWSEEEQDSFAEWLVSFMIENADARNELMRFPRKSKRDIERWVDEFILSFGWKTNYE